MMLAGLEQDIEELVDRALFEHQVPVHVGFTDRQFRLQDPAGAGNR